MRRRLFLILAIIALISCMDTRKTGASEPEKMVAKFFENYKAAGPKESLTALLNTNRYIPNQVTDSVSIKLERLTTGLEEFQGFEKIREKTYGDGILLLTYVVKHSRQPLRFNFTFYQPGDGWRIQNFSYEVEFLEELNEAVKPYRLKENIEEE